MAFLYALKNSQRIWIWPFALFILLKSQNRLLIMRIQNIMSPN